MFVSHLCVLPGEMSIQGFGPINYFLFVLILNCMSCLYLLDIDFSSVIPFTNPF